MYGGWDNYAGLWLGPAGFVMALGIIAILIVALWTIYWKGRALWHAARKGDSVWFVVLLVVNTVGILEILYLYVFSKKERSVE
ncbi:MAG: hypothetical protein RL681_540 [Candidatus Parcubacteria bacterium]